MKICTTLFYHYQGGGWEQISGVAECPDEFLILILTQSHKLLCCLGVSCVFLMLELAYCLARMIGLAFLPVAGRGAPTVLCPACVSVRPVIVPCTRISVRALAVDRGVGLAAIRAGRLYPPDNPSS